MEDIKELPNTGNGKAEFIRFMSENERDEYLKIKTLGIRKLMIS